MRRKLTTVKCFLLGAFCFFALPAYSQYFSNLYDCDSNHDFGSSVVLLPNGNYLVLDGIVDPYIGECNLGLLMIGQDGKHLLKRTFINAPPLISYFPVGYSDGGG